MTDFIKRFQKVPVREYPNNVPTYPLVSVCVQTYQHGEFIKQCLGSILMQKTNFEFEILLGEDDSTDGTREICIEFAEKFPEKIKLFLHSRINNINIGGNPSGRFNMLYNLGIAKGKYIALCEGDDYWIDPYKLQKQVDFLEANSDYGLVHSNLDLYDNNKKKLYKRIRDLNLVREGYIFRDLLYNYNFISTLTVLVKKIIILNAINTLKFYEKNWHAGDYPLWLEISRHNKIHFIDTSLGVYRLLGNSMSRKPDYKYQLNFYNSLHDIQKYFYTKFFKDDIELIKYIEFFSANRKLQLSFQHNNKTAVKKYFKLTRINNKKTWLPVNYYIKYYLLIIGIYKPVSKLYLNFKNIASFYK